MRYPLLILFLSLVNSSFACTCINNKPLSDREFMGYNLVVKGTIVSIDTANGEKKILVRVIDIYKGAKGLSKILVVTAKDNTLCGIDPGVDETWLIYTLEMAQYNYYTDACTKSKSLEIKRSGAAAKELATELKFLEKKKIKAKSTLS
ncbi:hypothetical protein BH09BAC3_BH09BAC3_00690 [soil metagenome]